MGEFDERAVSSRELIARGLEYAQKRLSSHTDYLHGSGQELAKELISLEDNALYSQLLMRSQIAQNILKARKLIERLLHFQVTSGKFRGCFPRYLHQFPCPGSWRWQKRFFGYLAFQRSILTKECGSDLCSALDKALLDLSRAINLSAPGLHGDVEDAIFELMQHCLQSLPNRVQQSEVAGVDKELFSSSWLRWGPDKVGKWLALLAALDIDKFERASALARLYWPPCCNWWAGLERRCNHRALSRPGIAELVLAQQSGANWSDWQRDSNLLAVSLITPGFKFLPEKSSDTWEIHPLEVNSLGHAGSISIGSTPYFSIQILQRNAEQFTHDGDFDLARFLWRGKVLPCSARLQVASCSVQLIESIFDETLGARLRFNLEFARFNPKDAPPLELLCTKAPGDTWSVDNHRTAIFTDGQELVYKDEMVDLTLLIRAFEEKHNWIGHVVPASTKQFATIDQWRVFLRPLKVRSSMRMQVCLILKKTS